MFTSFYETLKVDIGNFTKLFTISQRRWANFLEDWFGKELVY